MITLYSMDAVKIEVDLQKAFKEDYQSHRKRDPALWFGAGPRIPGLTNPVDRQQLMNMLNGMSPDGSVRLFRDARTPTHPGGWEFTITAPKSVSALWALAPEAERKKIEGIHRQAVEKALTCIEENSGKRQEGLPRKKIEGLAFATFNHVRSAKGNPELFTRALLVDLARYPDGTVGSLAGRDFWNSLRSADQAYLSELGGRFRSELRLGVQPSPNEVQLVEVPKTTCQAFSNGGGSASKTETLVSNGKVDLPSRKALLAVWQRHGELNGWGAKDAEALFAYGKKPDALFQQYQRWLGGLKDRAAQEKRWQPSTWFGKDKSKGNGQAPPVDTGQQSRKDGHQSKDGGQGMSH